MEAPTNAPWQKAPAQPGTRQSKGFDPVKYEAFRQKRKTQQNLLLGILGGLLGGIVGAGLWAFFSTTIGLEFGLFFFAVGVLIALVVYFINGFSAGLRAMVIVDLVLLAAVLLFILYVSDFNGVVFLGSILEIASPLGIGLLVGLGVRLLGRGVSPVYGIIGAVWTLLAIIAGMILILTNLAAQETGLTFFEMLSVLFDEPAVLLQVFLSALTIFGLLSYLLAIYIGYRAALRPISKRERSALMQAETPAEASETPAWPTAASLSDEPPAWPTAAPLSDEPPAWPTATVQSEEPPAWPTAAAPSDEPPPWPTSSEASAETPAAEAAEPPAR
jgi:hypothetical protein